MGDRSSSDATTPSDFARIRPAPENFLGADAVRAVRSGRRDAIRSSFLAALAGMAGGLAPAAAQSSKGDPDILDL
ncbi:MAG: hypothetical protein FJX57_15365, partial [Alphaproteobacteria bacterium]|nr:hypothetical protein [Alphaproteobacteria bacterium]